LHYTEKIYFVRYIITSAKAKVICHSVIVSVGRLTQKLSNQIKSNLFVDIKIIKIMPNRTRRQKTLYYNKHR